MCVSARERYFVSSPVVSSPMFVVRVIPAPIGDFSVFAEMKHTHLSQNTF